MRDHTCDRKGPPAKVDESGDEPIARIYPACSVCGVPQMFDLTFTSKGTPGATQFQSRSAFRSDFFAPLLRL